MDNLYYAAIQFDKLYQKGLNALQKENYNYSIELLNKALSLNPEDCNCRHKLHLAKIARFKKNPPNFLFMAKKLPRHVYQKIKINLYLLQQKYTKARVLLEANLDHIVSVNNLLQFAALFKIIGLVTHAMNTYKEVLIINPVNKTALIELIQFEYEQKNFSQTKLYIQSLLKAHPHNPYALKILRNIDALKTIDNNTTWTSPN
ncbi:MAG: hypothetical protein ABH952_01185 [Candidatus Omnitrophota bacterium]